MDKLVNGNGDRGKLVSVKFVNWWIVNGENGEIGDRQTTYLVEIMEK